MNEIVVPIDLTVEEKEILAIFSKRQFFIILPTTFASAIFLLFFNLPFIPGGWDFLIRLVVGLIAIGTAICLAFIRLDQKELFLSEYVVTMLKFKKSQKTYYS